MRAQTAVTAGALATAAVAVAGLAQGFAGDPVTSALTMSVPAKYESLVKEAGSICKDVNPNMVAALLKQESGFSNSATSPVGAQGIAQFMPGTWESHGVDANGDGKADPRDPEDAIPSAGKYLCSVADDVKSVPGNRQHNILAAYNAGSGAVKRYGGVPPYEETRNYVKSITALQNEGGGAPSSEQATAVVKAAAAEIGTEYSWGGGGASGPSKGICCSPTGKSGANITGYDCSGLTSYAWSKGAGVDLPRTASAQYAASKRIEPGKQKPGDLVFYGKSPESIHHVGIYIGGGKMIDAPRPGTKVRVDPLNVMKDLYAMGRPMQGAKETA